MILYSIVPPEIVFAESNPTGGEYIEMQYKGEKLLVSPAGENKYVINRLISTSPKAYLNPGLQPGTVINLAHVNQNNKTPV